MRKALFLLILLVSLAAMATDDLQAKCDAEGGCFLITKQAYDHLVGQMEALIKIIAIMKKEQCA